MILPGTSGIVDGGPASPTTLDSRLVGGLTMRDAFAAWALAGILAFDTSVTDTYAADRAYDVADAMMKRRRT